MQGRHGTVKKIADGVFKGFIWFVAANFDVSVME